MATHKGDVIHYFSWILRKVEKRPPTKTTPAEKAANPKVKKTPEERKEYERTRNQIPERREHQRQNRRESNKIAKETGKCVSGPNQAIDGQTRCEACAEKHRQSGRRSRENKRAANPAT